MRTLELFAGTQSFTQGVRRIHSKAETVTVDILPKFNPTIVTDLLTWDYTIYPPGYFDTIWCSPPCTEYSCAKTVGERKLAYADALVKRCFEILDYYKPRAWIIENPGTGLLPKRMPTLQPDVPQHVYTDYCAYGCSYRKRTAFWSNQPLQLQLCQKKACPSMSEDGKRHVAIIGATGSNGQVQVRNVWKRDAIPALLIDSLIKQLGINSQLS